MPPRPRVAAGTCSSAPQHHRPHLRQQPLLQHHRGAEVGSENRRVHFFGGALRVGVCCGNCQSHTLGRGIGFSVRKRSHALRDTLSPLRFNLSSKPDLAALIHSIRDLHPMNTLMSYRNKPGKVVKFSVMRRCLKEGIVFSKPERDLLCRLLGASHQKRFLCGFPLRHRLRVLLLGLIPYACR